MGLPLKPAKTVRRARRLRRVMSPVEVKLWCELRLRPGGLKFRHEHPAGPFSIDFYCAAAKLAIALDGAFHDRGDQPAFNAERDAYLERFGILTLRVPAREVYRDMDAVIRWIVSTATSRLPLHHSPKRANGPPPQAELGED